MASVGRRRPFGRAMKAIVVAGLVFLASVVVDLEPTSAGVARAAATCPSGLLARREVHTLTGAEWNRFITATRTLQQQHPSGSTVSTYDALVNRQIQTFQQVASHPVWFAWHRYYVRQFELKLQSIDPGLTVPYWDVGGLDSQAPEKSIVWNHVGHNGVGADHAVSDGPFMNWTPAYPTPHHLKREWNPGPNIAGFPSAEVVNNYVARSARYNDLRNNVEPVLNGEVHDGIGGDMVHTDSSNDPVFWLVHAYFDYLWSQWQQKSPANATDYNGANADGTKAQSSDQLPGFLAKVRDTFSTNSFCYRYEPPPPPTTGG
jgi:tyrosinase